MTKKNIVDIRQNKKIVLKEEHKRDRTARGQKIRAGMINRGEICEVLETNTVSEVMHIIMSSERRRK